MIDCRPLTPERWDDLERLFGPERGAIAGCWCMWFKLRRPEWDAAGRAGRKAMFRALVERGPPPGILAYAEGVPAGWCAVEPRNAYAVIERSHIRAPIDDRPAFAITCFYLAPRWPARISARIRASSVSAFILATMRASSPRLAASPTCFQLKLSCRPIALATAWVMVVAASWAIIRAYVSAW